LSTNLQIKSSKTANFDQTRQIDKFKNISNEWLEWFVGFAEGDGTFAITTPTNLTNTPKILTFEIKLSLVDEGILHHIKKVLGFGFIYTRQTQSLFRVKKLQDLKPIICIFNGYLIEKDNFRNFWKFITKKCFFGKIKRS
jgi:hypothetical protein